MPLPPTLHQLHLHWHVNRHQRAPDGRVLAGHHHHNVVVPLRQPLATLVSAEVGEVVTIRARRRTLGVVLRAWEDEAAVVEAVRPQFPELPRPLHALRRGSVYTYVDGTSLAETEPPGRPVQNGTMRRIAGIFGRLATVDGHRLPPRPAGDAHEAWPDEGDSAGFLARLARHAEHRVHLPNRRRFGQLFDDLEVPRDAVARFEITAKSLTPRPFGLLHTDIHRSNLVVRPGGDLCLVDWELALYGDPLHDLATHLARMRYGKQERLRMVELWRQEMLSRDLHARVAGMGGGRRDGDLARYLDFEYAQSVHADTMRAALSLPGSPTAAEFVAAAAAVRRALRRAQAPLDLVHVPTRKAVEEALRAWHARHHSVSGTLARVLGAVRRPMGRR
ncbi:aminoglycoside phosphotransferase family protein [Streptomyces sp. RKND-216]|uniref:aminoglycoside phosphotransferase family protein n=1 Tax=Streptomyces sp. RKND-216 TaxID=2562581 RepID=UPI00109DEB8D|nr:aminoglycoside phosphotransferase family protein [Streptomyces sp. RKND-216]THA25729.1 aminoglycoside phosphotransferase family protein [Streptomyces sp. RKND-216]